MDLTVIIVNYNSGELIVQAIQAVVNTIKRLDYEIIVADNHSDDDSLEQIEKHFSDQVHILRLDENKGFAAANNCALKVSKGRNILFLNPDTQVLEGAIEMLSDYLDTHISVGACGPNLYTPTMQPAFSYWMLRPGIRLEWNGLFSDFFLHRKYKGSHEHNFTTQVRPVAHIMGAALMVKASILQQVGPFDEAFFLFYEETELCHRIAAAGYELVNIPQAHVIHAEGQSINKLNKRSEYMMRSRAIYLRKCCSPFERCCANSILYLNSGLRSLWFLITRNTPKYTYWKYIFNHIRP